MAAWRLRGRANSPIVPAISSTKSEGIRPDGRVIGPPMPIPFWRNISDQDLRDVVAYLRTLPPLTVGGAK